LHAQAYLSRTTVRWLKVWLEHAGVEEGAVFRRLIGRTQIGGHLNSGSVALIFDLQTGGAVDWGAGAIRRGN
jgi:hypothetical protein